MQDRASAVETCTTAQVQLKHARPHKCTQNMHDRASAAISAAISAVSKCSSYENLHKLQTITQLQSPSSQHAAECSSCKEYTTQLTVSAMCTTIECCRAQYK